MKRKTRNFDLREFPFVLFYDPLDRIYIAKSIDLKGCHSQGENPQQTVENMYEAMEGWLETAVKKRIPIPKPSKFEEKVKKFLLRLEPQNASKLSLLTSAKEESINTLINEAIRAF